MASNLSKSAEAFVMNSKLGGRRGRGGKSDKVTTINVNVDMSESFSAPNGIFYVGTSESERRLAAEIAKACDIFIYTSDLHCATTPEFLAHGGSFPPHHLVFSDTPSKEASLGGRPLTPSEREKTFSPLPVREVRDAVQGRGTRIIAPRHVFFQTDGAGRPDFTIGDVERAFGAKWLGSPEEVRTGECSAIVSGKTMFNGTTVHALRGVEGACFEGVPENEDNAFSVLYQLYGLGAGLRFWVTGTVLSICVYQTASNIRQMFPCAEVCIVHDACTPLPQDPLAPVDWLSVVTAMSAQIGVKVISSSEILNVNDNKNNEDSDDDGDDIIITL